MAKAPSLRQEPVPARLLQASPGKGEAGVEAAARETGKLRESRTSSGWGVGGGRGRGRSAPATQKEIEQKGRKKKRRKESQVLSPPDFLFPPDRREEEEAIRNRRPAPVQRGTRFGATASSRHCLQPPSPPHSLPPWHVPEDALLLELLAGGNPAILFVEKLLKQGGCGWHFRSATPCPAGAARAAAISPRSWGSQLVPRTRLHSV